MSIDETMRETQQSPGEDGGERGTEPDDLVTRLLCAAAYLRESFADAVAGDLIRPSLGALAPLWQVDALRLVQHTRRARAARRARDRWLAGLVIGLVLTLLVLLRLRATDRMASTEVLVLAFGLAFWVYLGAVAVIARHVLGARRSALAAAYGPDDTTANIEPASLDTALKDLNDANVVFFEAESSPFLGSGSLVDQWGMTINLSKGLVSTGHRAREHLEPAPFTGADLQEYLLAAVSQVVYPRPVVGHRLHVRGGSTAPVVDLFRLGPTLPDPIEAMRLRRPVSRVPEEVLRRHLREPTEAGRVYSYFQHSDWGGQSVITLFVRAHVSNQTLFVEGLVYALRPLTRRFHEVRGLSQRPIAELVEATSQARRTAFALLCGSPVRVWRVLQNPLRPGEVRRIEREITGRRDLDFGAHQSLRERAATYYDTIDHFPAIDERMYHQIFNRRVLECIGAFLASKNVDTVEFTRQQAAIINRTIGAGEVTLTSIEAMSEMLNSSD